MKRTHPLEDPKLPELDPLQWSKSSKPPRVHPLGRSLSTFQGGRWGGFPTAKHRRHLFGTRRSLVVVLVAGWLLPPEKKRCPYCQYTNTHPGGFTQKFAIFGKSDRKYPKKESIFSVVSRFNFGVVRVWRIFVGWFSRETREKNMGGLPKIVGQPPNHPF